MTPGLPPPYSPMRAFLKSTLFRVGAPVGLVLLFLFSVWSYSTRQQRYVQGVADRWDAIREQAPGMERERQRTEEARQKARDRDRGKVP